MPRKKDINNYFPHDSNARNSDKLIRLRMTHKAAGYGVYFMILERLREEPNYMSVKDYNMIAFDLREDASLIKSVVEDFGLFVFTEDGKYFYSESFLRRMELKDASARRRSEAGQKGMSRRWEKAENAEGITKCTDSGNNVITTLPEKDNKESKGKESKGTKVPSPQSPPQGDGEGQDFLSSSLSQRDGIPRNLEGMCQAMKLLGIPQNQQDEIMRLSNFGQIGHPVWPLLARCRDSRTSKLEKNRINQPGKYILKQLREAMSTARPATPEGKEATDAT